MQQGDILNKCNYIITDGKVVSSWTKFPSHSYLQQTVDYWV